MTRVDHHNYRQKFLGWHNMLNCLKYSVHNEESILFLLDIKSGTFPSWCIHVSLPSMNKHRACCGVREEANSASVFHDEASIRLVLVPPPRQLKLTDGTGCMTLLMTRTTSGMVKQYSTYMYTDGYITIAGLSGPSHFMVKINPTVIFLNV